MWKTSTALAFPSSYFVWTIFILRPHFWGGGWKEDWELNSGHCTCQVVLEPLSSQAFTFQLMHANLFFNPEKPLLSYNKFVQHLIESVPYKLNWLHLTKIKEWFCFALFLFCCTRNLIQDLYNELHPKAFNFRDRIFQVMKLSSLGFNFHPPDSASQSQNYKHEPPSPLI